MTDTEMSLNDDNLQEILEKRRKNAEYQKRHREKMRKNYYGSRLDLYLDEEYGMKLGVLMLELNIKSRKEFIQRLLQQEFERVYPTAKPYLSKKGKALAEKKAYAKAKLHGKKKEKEEQIDLVDEVGLEK